MRLFSDVVSRIDDPHLARAAALAQRARGRAWPNPIVGCVIARDDRVVGAGYHPGAGEPHAEVVALAEAGIRARGATAYVTLEPCSHHGRTPPCVDALVEAGVARVVIGMRDPNPEASDGADRLAAAGIVVEFAADPGPFVELNSGWLHRIATGMPLVTIKSGLSLDARVAFAPGERAAITGPSGSVVTRRLREQADAIMVSSATLTADDPSLTIRDDRGTLAEQQPLRVVLVRTTVPRPDARVFSDGAATTLVLASDLADENGLNRLPADVLVDRWTASDGLRGAFRALAARGLGSVLVEPGPRLLSALWQSDLVDEYVTVIAGGMAGAGPSLYVGRADREGNHLARRFKPLEAGIVGDVSATVWGACGRLGDE